MDAPQKIYLFENPITSEPDWMWMFTKSCDEDIEYIRKDTLLEWLKKELEADTRFHETHKKPDFLHRGRIEAYKKVINKIESL